MTTHRITTPITDDVIMQLHSGDELLITGTIYTARDTAHKRMFAAYKEGLDLPVDWTGQIVYYVGPCPARPGEVIGSAGPTTSLRVDPYTPMMLDKGLKMMIGKGYRSDKVKQSLIDHKAVYTVAIGGAAALLATHIEKADVVAYEDLATEAIRKLEVVDFPVVVVNDAYGVDYFEAGVEVWKGKAVPV